MKTWRNFVDSISSRGGSILILLFITLVLGATIIRRSNGGGESESLIRNEFSGFAGALLMALTTTAKANGKSVDPMTPPAGGSSSVVITADPPTTTITTGDASI